VEIPDRFYLVAQFVEHWTSKTKITGPIPTVVKKFQLDWCVVPWVQRFKEEFPSSNVTPSNITPFKKKN
jgi:hypothetical protein